MGVRVLWSAADCCCWGLGAVWGPWECERRVCLKLASGAGVLCLVTIAVGWLERFLGFWQGWIPMFPLVTCVCDCGVCLDWCGCWGIAAMVGIEGPWNLGLVKTWRSEVEWRERENGLLWLVCWVWSRDLGFSNVPSGSAPCELHSSSILVKYNHTTLDSWLVAEQELRFHCSPSSCSKSLFYFRPACEMLCWVSYTFKFLFTSTSAPFPCPKDIAKGNFLFRIHVMTNVKFAPAIWLKACANLWLH